MSRISKKLKEMIVNQKLHSDEIVKNFMDGDSYRIDPLNTLKIIAASSIFGEASYYRTNVKDGKYKDSIYITDSIFSDMENKTTTEIFEEAIDNALSYDFKATLDIAVKLRNEYNMRLNPQVIAVRAAIHKARQEWTGKNNGKFAEYEMQIMKRADEPAMQLAYFLYVNQGKKNKMPSVLKRAIARKLSTLTSYQVNKYKNAEIGMINAVRLTHANSVTLDELMRTGSVEVAETEQTWEQKRSSGMGWKEIYRNTNMGHMALLRNIRNVFSEIDDMEFCKEYMEQLKNGVIKGRQFPFRYNSAYDVVNKSDVNHKAYILDTLEECIDIAIDNLPKLKGKTMALSDNSGSAWGAFTSEYGMVTVANIDNLSSVIAAKCSDEGYVGKFGDDLIEYPISKRNGTLVQANEINKNGYNNVGGLTEGGIWKFFKNAIENKIYFDNIFIFSDQQAGTGGLYGTNKDISEYKKKYGINRYINVYKLILEYRKQVNQKVNVFSVQTAGYNNVLLPIMSYRCAILTGWTGKEIAFASEYIKQWDEIENVQI